MLNRSDVNRLNLKFYAKDMLHQISKLAERIYFLQPDNSTSRGSL